MSETPHFEKVNDNRSPLYLYYDQNCRDRQPQPNEPTEITGNTCTLWNIKKCGLLVCQ